MKSFFLILLFPVLNVEARIGETIKQCTARYGEPILVNKETETYVYQKSGLQLIVAFWNGKAHQILVAKAEKDILNQPLEMSDSQLEALVAANSGGGKWKPGTEGEILDRSWESEDSDRLAVYFSTSRILVISTKAFALHEKAQKAEAEKKAMNGF